MTLAERAWHLQATEQFGWSKLELKRKIEEGAHLGAMVDIDKEETVCYTDEEVENKPATPETFGETSGGFSAGLGVGTGTSSEMQSFQDDDCTVYGCLNGLALFQKKKGSVRCLGSQSRPWLGPIMSGKQRGRLCHTKVGG